MSTEYIPKLLVGCYLGEITKPYSDFTNSCFFKECTIQKYLELVEGMFYVENEGFIGFEINVEESIDINIKEAYNLQSLAKKFKSITGQEAKLKACVYSY